VSHATLGLQPLGPDTPGSVDDLEYRERIGNYYADSYAPPQVM